MPAPDQTHTQADLQACNRINGQHQETELALSVEFTAAMREAVDTFRSAKGLPGSWLPSPGLPGATVIVFPRID